MDKNTLRRHLHPTLDGAIFPGKEDDYLTRYLAQRIDQAESLADLEMDLNYALAMLRRTKDALVALEAEAEGDETLTEGEPADVANVRATAENIVEFDLNGVADKVAGANLTDNYPKAGLRERRPEALLKIMQHAMIITGAKEVRWTNIGNPKR